jgi:hypothetical protein
VGPAAPEIAPVLPGLLAVAAVAIASPWLLLVPSTLTALLLAVAVLQVTYHAVKSLVSGHELLQLVFWVFSACYLIVPALYQLAYGQAAWRDYYIYVDDRRVQDTLIVLDVGFAAFGLGARSRPTTNRPAHGADGVGGVEERVALGRPRELLLSLGLAGASLALLPVVLTKTGFAALFSSRSERSAQFAASGVGIQQAGGAVAGFYGILPGALALAAAYLLLVRWRRGRRHAPLALVVSLALVIVYANPLANTRYVSSVAFVSLLFVVLQPRSRRGMTVVAMLVVLGLFAIYPVANAFRSKTSAPQPLSLSSIDFDGFQQLVNTQQYVEDKGHPLGSHLLSAVFFVVPRSIWESKSRPASIDVAENRGYPFTNLSLPIFGELYLDLGLAGAAVVLYGWGRLWRRLDDDWLQGFATGGARLVPYLAIAQVGLLRGPLGAQIPVSEPVALILAASLLPVLGGSRVPARQPRSPEAGDDAGTSRAAGED